MLLIFRLIVDFGLLVLIWMTQLIVYPAFVQLDEETLQRWHPRYNQMITAIVAPLMFAQLGLVSWELLQNPSFYAWASMLLVLAAWGLTFLQAVPLHGKIAKGKGIRSIAEKLVRVNWPRTAVWTVIFLLSLLHWLI
ncbi:hypothetical protein OAA90_03220 [Salibacteraceae bacterium]|jgi:hypothetical protein|nr:hypothetical protein [Salibacteraceae bacterium]MDB9725374.1 hypothetical protein [Salibacteraceae bacterium]